MLSVQEDPRGVPVETPEESPMGSLRSVGWDPLGVSGGIPEGSWRRSLRGLGGDPLGVWIPKERGKGMRYPARLPDGGLAKVVTGCLSAVYKCKMGGG